MSGESGRASLDGQLPAIFDSVADGVTVIDRSGVVRFANETAAQLMGLRAAGDVTDRPSGEVTRAFDLLTEDGDPMDPAALPTRRAMAGEPDPEAVVRFRHQGSPIDRWSLVRARLLRGATADEDLVVTAFQDITSLKLTERRLGFLAEASAILGESVDYEQTLRQVAELAVPTLADGCVVDVLEWQTNARRIAVAHVNPEVVTISEEIQRRWPPDPNEMGALGEVRRTGEPLLVPQVTDEMLAASARDPEHLELLRRANVGAALVVPLRARGQTLGVLTLVTGRGGRQLTAADMPIAIELGRRAGAAIDVARVLWEKEEAIRMRDEFIAIASHDMRTPLSAVRGYAQLALRHLASADEPDIQAIGRWLSDIDAGASRLSQLVSEFMDASLIRAGQNVPLQLQSTDLAKLSGERLEEHRRRTETHRFLLQAADAPVRGDWDPSRLARVLDNLLENAVKFSPDGGEIRVTVGREDSAATVSIEDQGIGIAASELELVFNPMYRGANARKVTGTGLGLAGSRRLIQQMGGSIDVRSRLGSGSTFTVRLPLSGPTGTAQT